MKKRLLAVLMTMVMAVSLAACGGSKDTGSAGEDASAGDTEESSGAAVTGETAETGEFSVLVPDGWTYEIANSSSIKVYKGEAKEDNANIDLRWYGADYLQDSIDVMISENEPVADIKAGDSIWTGAEGSYWLTHTLAVIGTDTPDYFIAFADLTGDSDTSETSFGLNDADVLAILGSIVMTGDTDSAADETDNMEVESVSAESTEATDTAEPEEQSAEPESEVSVASGKIISQKYAVQTLDGTETMVNFEIPDGIWSVHKYNEYIKIYNDADPENPPFGTPYIWIWSRETEEEVNADVDSMENLTDVNSRTIGGVEMTGRSYVLWGIDLTEYYGELPNGIWIRVLLAEMKDGPSDECNAILDSMSFE